MSLNPKQQAIVNWAKAQLEFFETSNDVKSYTHYNDIEQTLEIVCEDNEINGLKQRLLKSNMLQFYELLKGLQQ